MDYYSKIKNELIDNEIYKKVKDYSKNKYELARYYNVGKLLIEAQGGEERAKYGDGLIKKYAKKLSFDLGKKYNITLLKNARQFYIIVQKGPTLSDKLTWSHYVELLKINNINILNYYITIATHQNLSVRKLREKIKFNEYERLDNKTKNKLLMNKENTIEDFIKHPMN